jgi:hypothetical protein
MRIEQEPQAEDINLAIDTREDNKLQALKNTENYQDETRRWRNKKVCKEKIVT